MMDKKLIWGLLGALAVLSCGKEAPVEVSVPQQEKEDLWTRIPMVDTPVPFGEMHMITAGFSPETRSHLEVNDAGTRASVVWTAGDSFKKYAFYEGGSAGSASLTTSAGGANATFSDPYNWGTYLESHSIYPASAVFARNSITEDSVNYPIFGVTIPNEQVATPGSVAEGANLSHALAAPGDTHYSFHNLLSVVKFRMTGAIVEEVKSVTIKGFSPLSGDFVFYAPNGNPAFLPNINFTSHSDKYSTVSLVGDFEAGEDYYIAMVPSQQAGFQMIFANEDGSETTTLTSNGSFTFNRSDISDFGTIPLGDSFSDTQDPSMDPIQYMTATAGAAKPVTIAVIPDGYTADEMDDYEMDAKAGINALFATEPYKTYRSFFNVYILKVASNESGANITDGNGNVTTPVDCYFGSKWGQGSYSDMNADESTVYGFVQDHCPDIKNGIHSISEVPILMIINDSRYGGIAHTYSNGKTYCMVPTTEGNLYWAYPSKQASGKKAAAGNATFVNTPSSVYDEVGSNSGDWRNTLVHEFGGHSFARLRDEYWYENYVTGSSSISSHTWPVPFGLNVSASYSETPWDALLKENHGELESGEVRDDLVSLDPHYARIGVFQGADVSVFNRWRSERISCMIDNRFYFSAWQRYLIVQRILSLAGESPCTLEEFLQNDVTTDPVRDEVNNQVIGVSNAIPPRPVPLLPPPVLYEE